VRALKHDDPRKSSRNFLSRIFSTNATNRAIFTRQPLDHGSHSIDTALTHGNDKSGATRVPSRPFASFRSPSSTRQRESSLSALDLTRITAGSILPDRERETLSSVFIIVGAPSSGRGLRRVRSRGSKNINFFSLGGEKMRIYQNANYGRPLPIGGIVFPTPPLQITAAAPGGEERACAGARGRARSLAIALTGRARAGTSIHRAPPLSARPFREAIRIDATVLRLYGSII